MTPVVAIRTRVSTTALSEWEAWEVVRERRAGLTREEVAKRHGISVRTVVRYSIRTFTCRHCGEQFKTVAALWDHVWLPLEEAV
jgi:Homeodomain-like domain